MGLLKGLIEMGFGVPPVDALASNMGGAIGEAYRFGNKIDDWKKRNKAGQINYDDNNTAGIYAKTFNDMTSLPVNPYQ